MQMKNNHSKRRCSALRCYPGYCYLAIHDFFTVFWSQKGHRGYRGCSDLQRFLIGATGGAGGPGENPNRDWWKMLGVGVIGASQACPVPRCLLRLRTRATSSKTKNASFLEESV